MTVKPLFLFSLPRSGSTLVQRVLAQHASISTVSEPWLLLPLVYATREYGTISEYWHGASRIAIKEFAENLPDGMRSYEFALRRFTLELYSQVGDANAQYFLDKTPHYHAIAEDIVRIFPDAKCILLWRNPLAVAASMITTRGKGRWALHYRRFDLYDGIENLVQLQARHSDKLCIVHYEKLVGNSSASEWKQIFDYLGLEFDLRFLSDIPKDTLKGRMGDPTGVHLYKDVSSQSVDKWITVFGNPVRTAWARRYLKWIGKERLEQMGYSLDTLMSQTGNKSNWKWVFEDIIRLIYGEVIKVIDLHYLRYNAKMILRRGCINPHM